mgnify:FL=1
MIGKSAYIVKNSEGKYLTARKQTDRFYENRAGWSENIKEAKTFSSITAATLAAATNSANYTFKSKYPSNKTTVEIIECTFILGSVVKKYEV